MENQARIARLIYRQAVIITISLILGVFIYGGVGFYSVWTGHPANVMVSGSTYRLFQLGAFMLGGLAIAGSRFWTRRMLSTQGFGALRERHPKELYLATIIQGTAAESPVFLALALLFFSRDTYGFIPFAVFSLATLVLSFPQKQKWEEWLGFDF